MTEEKNSGWIPKSRFCLGQKAFDIINDMLIETLKIGHIARNTMKIKDIVNYYQALRTTYMPLSPVLEPDDKKEIKKKFEDLKKEHINPYNKSLKSKDRIYMIEELTLIEEKLYEAMQKINMYISVKKPEGTRSKRLELKDHIQGSGIPMPENADFL